MNRAVLGDVELEYELRGDGEPVLFIHPGIFADWFRPLLEESVLNSRYRLVHYHRVECAGSSRLAGPVSLSQQAAHGRSLLQRLGISRAHVVGHSRGPFVGRTLSGSSNRFWRLLEREAWKWIRFGGSDTNSCSTGSQTSNRLCFLKRHTCCN